MLGKRGGVQSLSLGERNEKCAMTCIHEDTILREFLHSFGLAHVQSRPDRDDYVEVIFDNIQMPSQYVKMNDALTFDVPYDGRSVMHYSWKALAKDEMRPTMLSKVLIVEIICELEAKVNVSDERCANSPIKK